MHPAVGSAGAQAPSVAAAPAKACIDTLSEGAMRRVAVYLTPELRRDAPWRPDNTPPYFHQSAGLLAQDIAARLRAAIGDSAGALPRGEPRLTWRALDGQLHVVLYRDGHVRVVDTLGADPSREGLSLVARTAEQVDASPEPQPWPDGVAADSLPIVFRLVAPGFDREGRVRELSERPLVPVFSVMHPWTEPVRLRHGVPPHYPEKALYGGAEGRVIMRFVVDSSGRADPATVEDSWPANVPRQTGDEGRYYRDFVSAVRRSILDSSYEPALVGGCPVRQQAQQPAEFSFRR